MQANVALYLVANMESLPGSWGCYMAHSLFSQHVDSNGCVQLAWSDSSRDVFIEVIFSVIKLYNTARSSQLLKDTLRSLFIK